MLVVSYEMHPKMQARLTLASELHNLHFKITSHICARWYYLYYYYSCLCSRSLLRVRAPAPHMLVVLLPAPATYLLTMALALWPFSTT